MTLPSAPATSVQLWIVDTSGAAATNNITVTGAQQINGAANYIISTNHGSVGIEYNATASQWTILATNATGGGVTFPLENNSGNSTFTAVGPAGSGSNVGYSWTTTASATSGDIHSQWLDGNATVKLKIQIGDIIAGSTEIYCTATYCGFFDSNSQNGLKISSQAVFIRAGNNGDLFEFDGNNMIPGASGVTRFIGAPATLMPGMFSKRFANGTQSIAFSATPAFDCTGGGVIHNGTVTGNITGPTMVAGSAGEQCEILFLKDGTGGTYTITGWGSNVRTAGTLTFTSGAGSLVTISFIWDDRLATPAWVEVSRTAFN